MTRWERQLQYAANLLVGGTGILYAIMCYFMNPIDEWAVINHPWQPQVQHLHVLVAPLLVFACGLIWQRHVASNRACGERRQFSGHGLVLMLVPMIVSGYLIQTTRTDSWRQAWIAVHLMTSACWLLSAVGHLVLPHLQKLRGLVSTPATTARLRKSDDLEG